MDTKAIALSTVAKYHTRNPFRLTDDLGFIVIFARLVDVRGLSQHAKRRNIIYINSNLPEQQQQLVCAHEVGHCFLHRGMNRLFMDRKTCMVPGKYEREANQFSVDFLYGDYELQPFLTRSIDAAAAYMGVPLPLAEYRMKSVQPLLLEEHE